MIKIEFNVDNGNFMRYSNTHRYELENNNSNMGFLPSSVRLKKINT